jgi:hypothetical protein
MAHHSSLGSFMNYDLGYIDLEEETLQPLQNPFWPKSVTCPYQKLRLNSFGGVEVPPIVRAAWFGANLFGACVRRQKKAAERYIPVENMRRVLFLQAAKRS